MVWMASKGFQMMESTKKMIEKEEKIRQNLKISLKQSNKEGGWNFTTKGLMGDT